MAEQIEDYGAPASDADIAAFQNMQQVDINTPAWQPGSRYDTQVRGLTSQDYTQHAPIEAPPRPEEPVYDTSVMPTTPETNWQQLYGRSENEKGELRRMLNEYNATLTATMAELTALRNAQSVNAYPTSPVHAQQPQYQLPETFFPVRLTRYSVTSSVPRCSRSRNSSRISSTSESSRRSGLSVSTVSWRHGYLLRVRG
jgi:hypothetical protein